MPKRRPTDRDRALLAVLLRATDNAAADAYRRGVQAGWTAHQLWVQHGDKPPERAPIIVRPDHE